MIYLHKPFGLTPLQAVEKLKAMYPEFTDKKLSYAGRLDPMAEGLLLILIDDENKDRRKLEHFDKEYEFEALLGIESDTYDLLGIPKLGNLDKVDTDKISEFVANSLGEVVQEYPPYSSIKVDGKPLYWWARRNKKVIAPKKIINISKLELNGQDLISSRRLGKIVSSKIATVTGDFRQEEILNGWKKLLLDLDQDFQVLRFGLTCSSGGYVRSLVHRLGQFTGAGAVTFSINRTKIGVNKKLPIFYI